MKHGVLRVGVLFGGRSSEHEVSLASARNVMDALQQAGHTVVPLGITRQGRWLLEDGALDRLIEAAAAAPLGSGQANGTSVAPPAEDAWALLPQAGANRRLAGLDVIFPVLHGPYGEDGTVQGLLDMASLPYVGCGVLASAVAMDKEVTKRLFAVQGLPQARYRRVMRSAWQRQRGQVLDELEAALAYALFVKPANMGSSVGVSKARTRAELAVALDTASRFDSKLVVEEGVPNAREIEVSILGNDDPIASIPGEIVPGNEFYDYAAKYLDDNSQLIIPARLTPHQAKTVQELAVAAFKAIDGAGLARVDFLMDDASGEIFVNEINTLPGFTRISMYPKLWEASGISYPDLVDRLIDLAMERYEDRQHNTTART